MCHTLVKTNFSFTSRTWTPTEYNPQIQKDNQFAQHITDTLDSFWCDLVHTSAWNIWKHDFVSLSDRAPILYILMVVSVNSIAQ